MKIRCALVYTVSILFTAPLISRAQTPLTNVILGHSGGTGSLGYLRKIIERDKIWEKYGLSVKSVYFSSGGVLTQALAGGNIAGSESEVPGMLNLAVSGVLDLKLVTVTINKIEHVFVVRKNIAKAEDLKGKKLAVSRIGSASDTVTRLVLKSWKVDPDKETTLLQSGNTPTRMTALVAGHVDGALVSPESVHRVMASGCCRVLADLADLPMDYARYGYVFPTAWIKANRDVLRRLLMGYLEGIAIFRTRARAVYAGFERKASKIRRSRKTSTIACSRTCGSIRCPSRMVCRTFSNRSPIQMLKLPSLRSSSTRPSWKKSENLVLSKSFTGERVKQLEEN